MGITLLDLVVGYDRLIIVDSVKTETGKPRELHTLELKDLKPTSDLPSSHGIDIASAHSRGF